MGPIAHGPRPYSRRMAAVEPVTTLHRETFNQFGNATDSFQEHGWAIQWSF
jgi:hypothetical protein